MDIHSNLKSRLRAALLATLSSSHFEGQGMLDAATIHAIYQCDSILPKHGKIADSFMEYVDEHPITEIFFGEMYKHMKIGSEYSNFLSRVEGFETLDTFVDHILQTIDQIPYEYVFSVPISFLSALLPDDSSQMDLAPDLTIATSDFVESRFILPDPPTGLGALFSAGPSPRFNGSILQITARGYYAKYAETAPQRSAVQRMRAVLGLMLAFNVCRREAGPFSIAIPTPHRPFAVHKVLGGDQYEFVGGMNVPEDCRSIISELCIVDDAFVKHRLGFVRQALTHDADRRIELAARWYFDSSASNNPLLAFVQAMVCLEILFGDKRVSDILGINELISNRCAYLIGKDPEDRTKILKDFPKIYDVRSRIVHRGHYRLTLEEKMLFDKLRMYCSRSLYAETTKLSQPIRVRATST